MKTLTKSDAERFLSLPKWARDEIRDLRREREAAVKALDNFTNTDKPSPIWVEEAVSDGSNPKGGPSYRRRFVQEGFALRINYAGVELTVMLRPDSSQSYCPVIDLSWQSTNRMHNPVVMQPRSFQQVHLFLPPSATASASG